MDDTSSNSAEQTFSDASSPDLSGVRVALIGAGNMGGPVGRAMLAAGVDPANLHVANSSRASSERAAEELGATAASRQEAIQEADVVVLGVKPYQILDLVAELGHDLPKDAVVLSLAAGITLSRIQDALPAGAAVVRAMPNTPISVGEGAVGLMRGDAVDDERHQLVHDLLSRAGVVVDITEDQVHAFIAAAGSLAGFAFAIIEAMTEEAVRQGLKRDLADSLVQQTMRGAATMLLESGMHPAVAKAGVCSPGGTTAEGYAAFEREGVRAGLAATMAAAAARSRELTDS
ncbi:pyrroline-5-carboxylate reductase [Brachybacterium ginsengisoli]|uniref:Pyrroline-5-carboxylate reductase n=1 Tax=Brachybacterium ginsengisoli TaxID=1331682 RepID=A0A291GVE4_9MICO|nr:pyrroline-5-carboxylate reductase [Brachybacterium ginsengisoli]ATG54074.1 pyrroline-5-carboxylate reductase [Brachybacterium ginsengisoli]